MLLRLGLHCLMAVPAMAALCLTSHSAERDPPPNLVGTWRGENLTVSPSKGYRVWGEKTVVVIDQQDRRFRGHFSYPAGTKEFVGVIYPDNVSFTWVASDSKGYNHGRILSSDQIGACYVEAGANATAGCAVLVRQQ